MARKSRKNNRQAEPAVVEQAAFATAIYARLSIEDGGKSNDGATLRNQIDVCREYISACPYLSLTEVYSDNGRTGTVFDRPAWNRLMDDVRAGRINAIVVRDLSRFGRDYIECGNYLEKIFPALGIRFISVKEHFDNFNREGAADSLSVSLQNLINALYSRDISRKVATALLAQQKNGTFHNRDLPYGYVWNEDHTAYTIDEVAAEHVRNIFQWRTAGVSLTEIVRRLNESGASTPESRKRETGVRRGTHQSNGWSEATVKFILRNPAYLGHTIHGRTRREHYKGVKLRECGQAEWIVYEHTHPALVSQEDFDTIQKRFQESKQQYQLQRQETAEVRSTMIDLFRGKCFCADCGKTVRMVRQRHRKGESEAWRCYYNCSGFLNKARRCCTSRHIIQSDLESKVLAAVRTQLQVALNYEKLLIALRDSAGEANLREKYNAAVTSASLKLNAVSQKRSRLYESYVDGILDEEEYLFAKQSYEKEHERLSRLQEEAIQRRNRFLESISPDNKWLSMMKAAANLTVLTQELVDSMIEKILVYGNKAIEIVFYYNDVYQDMCQSVLEMQEERRDG